ncbi:MAG: hypothetical protein WC479_06965 [Candidatus Izemoplasmatales bacterium]
MAKTSFWAQSNNSSDANFRLWAKGLSDALTAVGFTKTADTGQVDLSSAAKPASSYQMMGYEIRAFSDTLQSSNPMILKIEYGAGSSAAYPGIQITIGRATDGAGNFVGETANVIQCYRGSQGTSLQPCFVSADTNRVSVALFGDTQTYAFGFYIARTKGDDGSDTDTGVDIGYTSGTATYQILFPKRGLQYPLSASSAKIPCLCPYSGGFSYAGNIGLFPSCTNIGYVANPNLAAIIYDSAGLGSAGSIFTVSIFGQNYDFVASQVAAGTTNGNTTSTICVAMRYE